LKKILGIVVLGLLLSGCETYLADVDYSKKRNQTKPAFIKFGNEEFPKTSIGYEAKFKEDRFMCIYQSVTFWGYSQCLNNWKIYSNTSGYTDETYRLDPSYKQHMQRVIIMQNLLEKLEVIDTQTAFNNLDAFLYSENDSKDLSTSEVNINEFKKCNTENKFKTFVECLSSQFRN